MNESNKIEDLLEPLKIARRLEQEGQQFFLESARNAKSKLVKQTFEFLAHEEDKHLAKITEVYNMLEISDGNEFPDIEDSQADERLASFNDNLAQLKEKLSPEASDIEAYETALKFENGAEDLYDKMYLESENPKIKRFYKWLIDEEKMHARLLKSCLVFAQDPTAWFKMKND
ncbi:MAG: ferritin family protein [bacterium]